MRLLLLATVLFLAGMTARAQAAPEVFECPTETRAEVRHAGDGTWIATNQSSGLYRLEIQRIGTQRSMVCVYWLFGSVYWVHRPFPPRATCEINAAERRFYCYD